MSESVLSQPRMDFDAVVAKAEALRLTDPGDTRWREFLPVEQCSAFVRWASEHPKWRFNVADVADQICAKPVEAAVAILCNIVAEG